ncbi:hypothetical protein EYF80_016880 [Liparis tanakae]|uniref:Uncharacterized protein n=1 Tax=Liparis tanakae TaxID=230148 RepID=A0A4Z2I5A4_9TELE|nr:hypothetical protein EYF80_016880 [Liparis tanakae]
MEEEAPVDVLGKPGIGRSSALKPKGQERDLPSLDAGERLYLDYYRIFFWKSPDGHLHSAPDPNNPAGVI